MEVSQSADDDGTKLTERQQARVVSYVLWESGSGGSAMWYTSLLPGSSKNTNLTEELNKVGSGRMRKGLLCEECSPGFGPKINL